MSRHHTTRTIWFWLLRFWREIVELHIETPPRPGKLVAYIKDGVYEIVPYKLVKWGKEDRAA